MHATANRAFAFVSGLIFLLLAGCTFVPRLLHDPMPESNPHSLLVNVHYGYLFGSFPMNVVSDVLFVVIGVFGIVAAADVRSSRFFARVLCILSVVCLVLGFLPWHIDSLFGLMPLFGWNVGLFLTAAMFSFYFAWVEAPSAALDHPVVEH